MSTFALLFYTALGVAASVLLPVLSASVKDSFRPPVLHTTFWVKVGLIWKKTRKYVLLGLFSLITAAVILAFYQSIVPANSPATIDSWGKALFFGYTCDSTLQKIGLS